MSRIAPPLRRTVVPPPVPATSCVGKISGNWGASDATSKKPDGVAFGSQSDRGPPALLRGDPETSAAKRSAEEGWEQRSGVTRRGVDHRLGHGSVAYGRSGLALGRSGRHQFLAPALGRGLDHAARAPDRRKGAAIEIVNVTAGLQLAGVVDEGGLIGEVDPDRRRLQLKVLLAAAEHARDPRRRPVLLRTGDIEENLGVFRRILHAHAAVAVGADLMGEIILVRGVVLIDQEPVWKVEPDPTQRIVGAGRLGNRDATAAVAHV